VESARIVTADSRIVTASAETNPDLYWACRGGGGGNFGVVTSWKMTTFPTAPVVFFTLSWPASAADQVLPAWQDWVQATPDEMWSNCLLLAQPSQAGALLQVSGVYVGTRSDASGLIAKLIAVAGTPLSSFIESVPFAHAMYVEANCAQLSQSACHLPTQVPGGQLVRSPSTAKSELLTTPLADAGVAAIIEAVGAAQGSGLPGAVAFDALGGATARPPAGATAWVHRDARFSVQYSVPLATTDSPGVRAGYKAWLDGLYHQLRPHVSGQSYQNYIDPDLPDWKQAYYGANLSRLEQVRKKWDPDATFRFAQVIPVA
jgi:FAD/FMN-containing dehydrogenase